MFHGNLLDRLNLTKIIFVGSKVANLNLIAHTLALPSLGGILEEEKNRTVYHKNGYHDNIFFAVSK